jgi:Sulfotransferase family
VIEEAPFLLRLFPGAKFINMVRDGRAVVAGTLRKVDLTDDPMRALEKWETMVRAADEGMRRLPPDRALTVHLDDLTALDRETTFQRVVEFLETEDAEPMRRYFDTEISAERANVGRWRQRMAPQDARKVDRRYRRLVRRLRRRGIEWVPVPEPR